MLFARLLRLLPCWLVWTLCALSATSQQRKPTDKKRVLVVGGLVLDIISSSSSPIIRATSNIGAIHQSSGGADVEAFDLS